MTYEVYAITHISSGMRYVGCTRVGLERRWQTHLASVNSDQMSPFYEAIRLHGPDAFRREVLETFRDRLEAYDREVQMMHILGTFWPNGFNRKPGERKRRRARLIVRNGVARFYEAHGRTAAPAAGA